MSPIVLLISIYIAVAYGILYLLFTTYTFVFEEHYGFAPGSVGLTYIPSGIGMLLSMFALGTVSDRIIQKHQAAGHTLQPEMRLSKILTIPGGISLPIGLFIYGWTAQYHVHWIVPLIGTAFVGAGIMGAMIPTSTYLIDAFQIYAASAIAANGFMRSLLGACFRSVAWICTTNWVWGGETACWRLLPLRLFRCLFCSGRMARGYGRSSLSSSSRWLSSRSRRDSRELERVGQK